MHTSKIVWDTYYLVCFIDSVWYDVLVGYTLLLSPLPQCFYPLSSLEHLRVDWYINCYLLCPVLTALPQVFVLAESLGGYESLAELP